MKMGDNEPVTEVQREGGEVWREGGEVWRREGRCGGREGKYGVRVGRCGGRRFTANSMQGDFGAQGAPGAPGAQGVKGVPGSVGDKGAPGSIVSVHLWSRHCSCNPHNLTTRGRLESEEARDSQEALETR